MFLYSEIEILRHFEEWNIETIKVSIIIHEFIIVGVKNSSFIN